MNNKLMIGGILSLFISGDFACGMQQRSGWSVVMSVDHDFWGTAAGEKIIGIFNGEKPSLVELGNLLDNIISGEHDPAVPSREEKRSMNGIQRFILNNWNWMEPKLGRVVIVRDNSDLNPEQGDGVMQNALPAVNPMGQLNVAPQAMVRPSRVGCVSKDEYYERLCLACGNEKAQVIKNCFAKGVPLSGTELFEWLDHCSMGRKMHGSTFFESSVRVDAADVYEFINKHFSDILEIAENCPKWEGVRALYEERALVILFNFFSPELITKRSAYNLVDNMFFTFYEYEGLAPVAYVARSRNRIWKYIVNNEQAIRNLLTKLIAKGYTTEQLLSSRALARKQFRQLAALRENGVGDE